MTILYSQPGVGSRPIASLVQRGFGLVCRHTAQSLRSTLHRGCAAHRTEAAHHTTQRLRSTSHRGCAAHRTEAVQHTAQRLCSTLHRGCTPHHTEAAQHTAQRLCSIQDTAQSTIIFSRQQGSCSNFTFCTVATAHCVQYSYIEGQVVTHLPPLAPAPCPGPPW